MPRILYTGPSPRGWHRLQTVLECDQKFAWEYRFGKEGYDDPSRTALLASKAREKEDSPGLTRGTLMHLGLAHYYARLKQSQSGLDPEEYLAPADAIRLFAEVQGHPYLRHSEDMVECVEGYVKKYAPLDNFKILHVEELFEANIGGYRFTGRLDLVIEDSRGQVWAFDHKGTGHIDAKHRQYYSISGQLLGYKWLVRGAYPDRFAGLRINLIQHGNNDFKYERPQLLPAPALEADWLQVVIDAEERIARNDESGRPYDKWPKAANEMTCFGRYGACPHIEKCKWGALGQ